MRTFVLTNKEYRLADVAENLQPDKAMQWLIKLGKGTCTPRNANLLIIA